MMVAEPKDVSGGEPGPRQLIYRSAAITTDHIQRFTSAVLRDLLTADGVQYDIVHSALSDSGLQPLPALQCDADHFETRLQRVNAFADALVANLLTNDAIRAAMNAVVTAVLNAWTVAAPDPHLTPAELDEFRACCVAGGEDQHINDYDRCAALHAHLGTCSRCNSLLSTDPTPRGGNERSSIRMGFDQ
jgi:hypothetical protein